MDESEGRLWAESRGFLYFETSAQTGEGINEMFQVRWNEGAEGTDTTLSQDLMTEYSLNCLDPTKPMGPLPQGCLPMKCHPEKPVAV